MTGPREFPGRSYDNWKTTDPSDAEPNPFEQYADTEPDPDYEPKDEDDLTFHGVPLTFDADRDDEYAPLFVIVGWEWMQ